MNSKESQRDRVKEIIVFFVNGSTFEEAAYIRKYNETVPGASILLGGTTVHNSRSIVQYLESMEKALR